MAEQLKRRIGLGLLTAYGVGVMVGAGIYVLVGAVAGQAGLWAPVSFLLAGAIAAPTALSYAEFSTRIPEAAGEAAYVGTAMRSEVLALLMGLAIVAVGMISAAAVLRGGVGYLLAVVDLPRTLAILAIGGALTVVAVIGVMESLSLAALFTAVELLGLALVVWAGANAPPVTVTQALPVPLWPAIGAGAVLAFFAFIGFEDIVNMAEEVARPERNLPLAIILSLVLTTLIYTLVAWATVRAVPLATLSGSEKPLALVWQAGAGGEGRFLSAIAVFAAMNGVLAQIVMASRVLFGLGKRSPALALFHHAHPRFATPVLVSLLIGAGVILGALLLDVGVLAEATSSTLLGVFVVINLALILLKRRAPAAPFRVPMAVPVCGLVLSAGALAANLFAAS
ncbi:APC family permease [Shimia sp.]|uniref:APC family permease n=1 Tax=Shimia sp. TaxID=1954381 RepID=UPI003561CAEF